MPASKLVSCALLLLTGILPAPCSGSYIYWSDELNGTDSILRAKLLPNRPATDVEVLVSNIRTKMLAVDEVNEHLYYGRDGVLFRANLDGSNSIPLISGVFGSALAVDPINEHIYVEASGGLQRFDFSGQNISRVTSEGGARSLAYSDVYGLGRSTSLSSVSGQVRVIVGSTASASDLFFNPTGTPSQGITFDDDDGLLIVGTERGTQIGVKLIDIGSGTISTISQADPFVKSTTADPIGNTIYWASLSGDIFAMDYDGTNLRVAVELPGGFGNPQALLFSSVPVRVPGDANGDGIVDLIDLDVLGANFRTFTDLGAAGGDFTGDGFVGLDDLDILGTNFGLGATVIPEPTGFALMLLAVSASARLNRHRCRQAR